jgi:predicted ATPase
MDSGELEFDDSLFFSQLHSLVNEGREGNNLQKVVIEGNSFVHVPVGIKGNSGALPKLGNVIKSTLDNGSEQVCRVLEEVLSDMLVAPLDNLKAILQESLCIGPLREIPDPTYQSAPYSESKDWFSGKAAWDILAQGNSHFAKRVSIWTSSKDKLNLGIGLAVKRTSENTQYKIYASDKNTHQYNSDRYTQGAFDTLEHEFNVLKELSLQFQNMLADNYNEYIQAKEQDSEKHSTHARELQEMFHDQQIKTECHIVELIDKQRNQLLKSTPTTVIWDLKKSMEVSPIDLGVGISQLLPFVVAALAIKKGIIAVEQPELHVHPRVQVGIGDLLTQVDTKANFLIETHSEHIILRILRRIRETSDNELPEGFKPVTKEDVSIVYLEPSENGVTTKRIEIDDDGEFIDRWPHGFFSERRDEVM